MTPSKRLLSILSLLMTGRDIAQGRAPQTASESEPLGEDVAPSDNTSSTENTNYKRVVEAKTSYGTTVSLYQSSETGLKVFVADVHMPIVLDCPPFYAHYRCMAILHW